MAILTAHNWPGNVRELKSAIFRSVVMCNGNTVQAEDISLTTLARNASAKSAPVEPPQSPSITLPLRSVPVGREALAAALLRNRENVSATAQELGVSRVTLYRMLRRFAVTLDRPPMDFPKRVPLSRPVLPQHCHA